MYSNPSKAMPYQGRPGVPESVSPASRKIGPWGKDQGASSFMAVSEHTGTRSGAPCRLAASGLGLSIEARTCKSQDVISSRLRQPHPSDPFLVTAVSLPARRVHAVEKTESGDWKPFSDRKGLPLNHQQILKHLRTANEVAKETAEFGHHPFGAVLVAPDGERVLMKQGNLSSIACAD